MMELYRGVIYYADEANVLERESRGNRRINIRTDDSVYAADKWNLRRLRRACRCCEQCNAHYE